VDGVEVASIIKISMHLLVIIYTEPFIGMLNATRA